jgi:hypothetical protein
VQSTRGTWRICENGTSTIDRLSGVWYLVIVYPRPLDRSSLDDSATPNELPYPANEMFRERGAEHAQDRLTTKLQAEHESTTERSRALENGLITPSAVKHDSPQEP